MNEQDNASLNRQIYLLEQKVEQITEVLSQIYDVFYFAEDKNGNDLIRPSALSYLKSQLDQLRELPDA